jgi:hypothetical protein
MDSMTRSKLELSIAYHQAMAEDNDDELETEQEEGQEQEQQEQQDQERRPLHRGDDDPRAEQRKALAETHYDVVRQLQALLDAEPPVSGIEQALANQTVRRATMIQRGRTGTRTVIH